MIETTVAAECRRLLEDPAATHRSVAAALGIGKSSVGRIARGEWDAGEGPRDDDPTPAEIRERCRAIRQAGGGELVSIAAASKRDLAEDTKANRDYFEAYGLEAPAYNFDALRSIVVDRIGATCCGRTDFHRRNR